MKQIITKKWLEKHDPCQEGVDKFVKLKQKDTITLIKLAIKSKNTEYLEWANWTIARAMTKKERIMYAIYAAKLVLKNFETKYPKDKRPRQAIQAATKYLNNPTLANKNTARSAAWSAESASDSAARSAESAAESAAWSAAESAESAAESAAWSARSAMQIKILKYGLKIGAKK